MQSKHRKHIHGVCYLFDCPCIGCRENRNNQGIEELDPTGCMLITQRLLIAVDSDLSCSKFSNFTSSLLCNSIISVLEITGINLWGYHKCYSSITYWFRDENSTVQTFSHNEIKIQLSNLLTFQFSYGCCDWLFTV